MTSEQQHTKRRAEACNHEGCNEAKTSYCEDCYLGYCTAHGDACPFEKPLPNL